MIPCIYELKEIYILYIMAICSGNQGLSQYEDAILPKV